jgi:hypothetical protein
MLAVKPESNCYCSEKKEVCSIWVFRAVRYKALSRNVANTFESCTTAFENYCKEGKNHKS